MMARHHVMVAAGLSAVAAAAAYRTGRLDLVEVGAFVAVGAGAGLVPDVDEPGSSAPRTFGWLGMSFAWLVRKVVRKHRGATHTVEVLAGFCLALWWLSVPHPAVAEVLARAPRVGEWLAWPALGHPLVVAVACGWCVAVGVDTVRGVSSTQALIAGCLAGVWVAVSVQPGEWWPAAAVAVGWLAHLLSDTPTPHGVPWSVFALPGDHRLSARLFRTGSVWEPLVAWPVAVGLVFAAWKISGLTYNQALHTLTGAGIMGS